MGQSKLAIFSCVAGTAAAAGDFIVTGILGSMYKGYNFIYQPESFLGTSESPVAALMNAWGILLCFLLVSFGLGFFRVMRNQFQWVGVVAFLIIVYGLTEGLGSSIFPYNHDGETLSNSGKLHALFGAIGGVAIVYLPFAGMKMFPVIGYPRLHKLSMILSITGLAFTLIFVISESGVIPFRGLLQRLYLLNYHLYLVVLAIVMTNRKLVKR